MNFGDNLKRLRKERNLSQEQLSEMLNVSRQAISKWESNKTYPDIENLMLLSHILGYINKRDRVN
ncbi:TPA: helix-turn-helix transcriptional regulator [Clostridioides difficile]|nr:helix-turn-helix transcriptional regulator [Clostridioides difficile]